MMMRRSSSSFLLMFFGMCLALFVGNPGQHSSSLLLVRVVSAESQSPLQVRSRSQQRRRRHLQKNPLDVLHEVWHDAANQHASSVITDCIKPPPPGKGGKGKGSHSPNRRPTRIPTAAPSVTSSPTTKSFKHYKSSKSKQKSKKGKYCEEGGSSPPTSRPNNSPSAPSGQPVPALPPNPAVVPPPSQQSNPTIPTRRPAAASPNTPNNNPPSPNANPPPAPDVQTPVAPPPTIELVPPSSTPNDDDTNNNGKPAPAPPSPAPPTNSAPATAPSASKGDNDRCAQVADATLVTGVANTTTFRLNLGLRFAPTVNVESALEQLQSALQSTVAPLLTNCQSYDDETNDASAEAQRHREQRRQQESGLSGVDNVVFGPRSALDFVDCQETFSNSLCLNSGGRVTAYGLVDSQAFSTALKSTIASANLNVTDLQEITSVTPKAASSDTAPVPEGQGNNDKGGGGGAPPAIVEPLGNVGPGDGKISAGAAVGIALAALLLLLIALFAVRHRRRHQHYDRRDALKLAQLTEDEDDVGGASSGADAVASSLPASRKVHVLGEDDSLLSGNNNRGTVRIVGRGFQDNDDDTATIPTIEPVTAVALATNVLDDPRAAELVHDHYCASPNCDICALRKRHYGVRFVPTATATPISPSLPVDARRSYTADDTVLL